MVSSAIAELTCWYLLHSMLIYAVHCQCFLAIIDYVLPDFFAKADGAILILQNKWKIRLQLTKPVTWPPLVWGVVCGAAASGMFLSFK